MNSNPSALSLERSLGTVRSELRHADHLLNLNLGDCATHGDRPLSDLELEIGLDKVNAAVEVTEAALNVLKEAQRELKQNPELARSSCTVHYAVRLADGSFVEEFQYSQGHFDMATTHLPLKSLPITGKQFEDNFKQDFGIRAVNQPSVVGSKIVRVTSVVTVEDL